MLQETFFKTINIRSGPGRVEAVLKIDPAHEIFKGHFPGQPVVPGVCMMHMVKEVMEKDMSCSLGIVKADYLKFLTIINPNQNAVINADLNYSVESNKTISITATLFREDIIYFKMKCTFLKSADQAKLSLA